VDCAVATAESAINTMISEKKRVMTISIAPARLHIAI